MLRRGDPGYVVLEDGSVFSGYGFGAPGPVVGGLVFNTAMTGYQETVTDPSGREQIVVFTYPMIGNCGAGGSGMESDEVHSRAVIVRDIKNTAWNAGCPDAWVDWLTGRGLVGLAGVDTRALTRRIREHGEMKACVAAGKDVRVDDLITLLRGHVPADGGRLVDAVSCRQPYEWPAVRSAGASESPLHVVAVDLGIKRSVLKCLAAVGCRTTVVPARWSVEQILAAGPDGVVISGGPGDPAELEWATQTVRGLLGKAPLFGIGLGHLLLARAVGLSTYRLKVGHRGGNHPVRDYLRGRVEITSQNHAFAVEPPSSVEAALAKAGVVGEGGVAALAAADLMVDSEHGPIQVTHLSLNDGTVEGLRSTTMPVLSVQYHPEGAPGPHDGRYLFDEFVQIMQASEE
jgi:carbamoyl-phosphate synthase small subunit